MEKCTFRLGYLYLVLRHSLPEGFNNLTHKARCSKMASLMYLYGPHPGTLVCIYARCALLGWKLSLVSLELSPVYVSDATQSKMTCFDSMQFFFFLFEVIT